jgi:hypothetical protein
MVAFADWMERSHGGGRKCPAIYKPGLKDAHDKDPESFIANVTVEGSTLEVQMSVWTMVAGAISAGLKAASATEPTDLQQLTFVAWAASLPEGIVTKPVTTGGKP